jgi:hypothetical protein
VRTLLLILFLLASRAASAQVARPWPRNAATGKIEFNGHLPWPDSVRTEAQRQLLARRWYRQKLTNTDRDDILNFVKFHGTTYSGIPMQSCYRLRIMSRYENLYSLCFNIALTPDNTGLTYQFTEFDFTSFVYDAGGTTTLEGLLMDKDAILDLSLVESLHEQLLAATRGW